MVVVPAETPVTTPAELTVATDVFDDDQEPPDVVSDRVVVLPAQRDDEPEIGAIVAVLVSLRMLLLFSSEKNMLLFLSNAIPEAAVNSADVANPPSPL